MSEPLEKGDGQEAEQKQTFPIKRMRRNFINIGAQKKHWMHIKTKKKCKSDEELAKLLIKSSYQLDKRKKSFTGITAELRKKRKMFTQKSHRVLLLQNDEWSRWRELKCSLNVNCNSQLAKVLIDAWYDRYDFLKKLCDTQQENRQENANLSSSGTNANISPEFPQPVKVEYASEESAEESKTVEESESDREIDDILNHAKGEKKLIKLTEKLTEDTEDLGKQRKSSRVQSLGYRPDYANLDWRNESDSDKDNKDNIVVTKPATDRKRCKAVANTNNEEDKSFIDNMSSLWGQNSNKRRQAKKRKKEEDPDFVVSDDDIKELDVSDDEKADSDISDSYGNENDKLDESGRRKKSSKRRKVNPDGSMDKKSKRKRIKKENLDGEENKIDELESKAPAKKKKEKLNITETVKKPWIRIKLEEHTDKFKMEVVGSFERKNRKNNLTEEMYTCLLCGRFKSTAKEIFEEHMEKHVNKVLECHCCPFVGRSEMELVKHRTCTGHSLTGQQYMCDICGMVLFTWDSRLTHMGKEHDNPQFKCKYCERKFVTRLKRQKHQRGDHSDRTQYCFSCKTDCQALSAEEFKEHTSLCKPCHQCQICGVFLASKMGVRSHVLATHLGVRKYQCPTCPYAGKSAQRLREHEMTHKNVHPYSCDKCTFTCIQAYQLTSHMRTHSGEKPYKCSQCKFAAAWNVQLKDHVKVHGMETSVACLLCDIIYKNSKALKMHEKKEHS